CAPRRGVPRGHRVRGAPQGGRRRRSAAHRRARAGVSGSGSGSLMFPLRDVIPSRTTPYITVTIIILNAVAWLFELSLPRDVLPVFLQVYGVVPATFRVPTLVTSMFLHGGWSHILGNMWYLWIFGDNVEDRVGHGRFIVFYLLCGAVAALGQIAID